MNQVFAIMLGGSLGALFRYLVSNGIYNLLGRNFPYGTLSVNIIGSFLMGFLSIFLLTKASNDTFTAMILVGFLGAFTTFSTFSMDNVTLLSQGELLKALLNIFLNVAICLLAVWIGIISAKQF